MKNVSSEIKHADVVVNAMNDEVSSIFSQIVEQIEVILEVVLSEVSKLINSVMIMRRGDQRNHSFLEEKKLHKIKNGFSNNKHPEMFYLLMDRVTK